MHSCYQIYKLILEIFGDAQVMKFVVYRQARDRHLIISSNNNVFLQILQTV